MLTQEIVRELLDYDPETGRLIWKERDRKWFKSDGECKRWNNRYAGKLAFVNLTNDGYYRGNLLGKEYKAHRIIWMYMEGRWPEQVDHQNHIRTDNRWSNIRTVSNQENHKNQSKFKNNTSGYTGIVWHVRNLKWYVQITINNKKLYLGCFDLLEDAIKARKTGEMQYNFHPNHGVRDERQGKW